MKIRVTLKDPDTMPDAVAREQERQPKPEGIDAIEWDTICEDRARAVQSVITERWMPYGGYLVVEFDTEAGTATVLAASELR